MIGLRLYGLLGAALAGAIAFGYLTHLRTENARLRANLGQEAMKYSQCLVSLGEARDDRRRDDEIDRIPDHGLRDAAREWLLGPAPNAPGPAPRP